MRAYTCRPPVERKQIERTCKPLLCRRIRKRESSFDGGKNDLDLAGHSHGIVEEEICSA